MRSYIKKKKKRKKVSSVNYGIYEFIFCKEKKRRSHTGIIRKSEISDMTYLTNDMNNKI